MIYLKFWSWYKLLFLFIWVVGREVVIGVGCLKIEVVVVFIDDCFLVSL